MNFFNKFLKIIERAGNALPHPVSIFAILAGLVIIFSAIGSWLELSVFHPGTGKTMLPYTVVFLFSWLLLLVLWIRFEIPFGPGSKLSLTQ